MLLIEKKIRPIALARSVRGSLVREVSVGMVREVSVMNETLQLPSPGVCIAGTNRQLRSNVYGHFGRGLLLPSMVSVFRHVLYRPDLQLAFGRARHSFGHSFERYYDFFQAIFDARPIHFRDCRRGLPDRWRVVTMPDLDVAFARDASTEFANASTSSIARECEWLPLIHSLAAARRHARPRGQRPLQMILLLRSPPADSSRARGIRNVAAVAKVLEQLMSGVRGVFRVVTFNESQPALSQVDLMLETDVLVSYHGSGVSASHYWMPPGGVAVEVMPPHWPYCVTGVCVAHGGKFHIQLSPAGTARAEQWKVRGWRSPLPSPSGLRNVHMPGAMLEVLQQYLTIANATPAATLAALRLDSSRCGAPSHPAQHRPRAVCTVACGGRGLQFWEGDAGTAPGGSWRQIRGGP